MKNKFKYFHTCVLLACISGVWGNELESGLKRPRPSQLPYEIPESQRLSPSELKHKKEGWYAFALPSVSWDETLGVIYGIGGGYVNNGSKNDPFYE